MAVTIGSQRASYEVTALLGKGGFGEVYQAKDRKLKRDVAIKLLPDEFSRDPDRVSRFQREAEVLAQLNHPNIAAIYDLASHEKSLTSVAREVPPLRGFDHNFFNVRVREGRSKRRIPSRILRTLALERVPAWSIRSNFSTVNICETRTRLGLASQISK